MVTGNNVVNIKYAVTYALSCIMPCKYFSGLFLLLMTFVLSFSLLIHELWNQ